MINESARSFTDRADFRWAWTIAATSGSERGTLRAAGRLFSQTLGNSVTKDLDQPTRTLTNIMWRTRRFAAPLREIYPVDAFATDDPTSEQFLELLEQAERRLLARKQGC